MSRVLDFTSWLGGADNVQAVAMFPGERHTKQYQFRKPDNTPQDIAGYSFKTDWQSIVVDQITYDRETRKPNFADSQVIGYFPSPTPTNTSQVVDSNNGRVDVTIPEGRYTGPVVPNARQHVVVTVFTFEWTQPNGDIHAHRWAILETWEAGVNTGDPVLDTDFTGLVVGS